MTANAIEAVGLSKRFAVHPARRNSLKEAFARGRPDQRKKYFWALRDATFNVPRGASLGLIGANGSGKSTALKVLTGIYRPTSGSVEVSGTVSALLEVGAGFHPELTGRENIRLNATILGFSRREIDRLMDSIIEFADVGDHIDAPIKHFSSGMYVRLGFAVAVMIRPDILLVDEVIAVGDEAFQRKCFDHLHELRRGGTSMIIVSHGLGQIADLCDEAIWLEGGHIREIGPTRSIVRGYLDDVNDQEVARNLANANAEEGPASKGERAADSQVDLDASGYPAAGTAPRPGSGEVRIQSVEYLDDSGQPLGFLITGRPVTVRIRYRAYQRVAGVKFGVGFDDAEDRVIAGVNSAQQGLLDVPVGDGWVDFQAGQFLLASGVYRVRVGVRIDAQIIDLVENGLSVTVRPPDVEMAGTYLQPGGWAAVGPTPVSSSASGRVAPAAPSKAVAPASL